MDVDPPRPPDAVPPRSSARPSSTVVELRQRALRPGRREDLIDLFDRSLVDAQEAAGIRVLGQFQDLDDPNRFVWMCGFTGLAARERALAEFYGSNPVWSAHRAAVEAMAAAGQADEGEGEGDVEGEGDDKGTGGGEVLVLTPVDGEPAVGGSGILDGLLRGAVGRPAVGEVERPRSLLVATVHHLKSPALEGFADFYEWVVQPLLSEAGAPPLFSLRTDECSRVREHIFVRFSRFADVLDYRDHLFKLEDGREKTDVVRTEVARYLARPSLQLRLAPTARSLLR